MFYIGENSVFANRNKLRGMKKKTLADNYIKISNQIKIFKYKIKQRTAKQKVEVIDKKSNNFCTCNIIPTKFSSTINGELFSTKPQCQKW